MGDVVVTRVEPYGDCADISLRCGHTEITVFAFGSPAKVNDIVREPLRAFDCDTLAAYLDDWPEEIKGERSREWIEKTTGPYGYRGCGRVVDQEQGIIEVLGFLIDVGELLSAGAVEFECVRLDM